MKITALCYYILHSSPRLSELKDFLYLSLEEQTWIALLENYDCSQGGQDCPWSTAHGAHHSKVHGTHQKWLTEHLQHFDAHTSFISKNSLPILFVFCCDVTPSCLILMGRFKSTLMTLRRTSQVYIKSKTFVFLRLLILVQILKTSVWHLSKIRQHGGRQKCCTCRNTGVPSGLTTHKRGKECKQIHGHF